ncbi:MAG: phage tail tube protein [Mycobacterium sp.]
MAESTGTVQLAYKQESTWGTAATGNYALARPTSVGLSPNLSATESDIIRSDGNIQDVVRTDAFGGGTIAFELQEDETDEFMRSCLLSTAWTSGSASTTASTISATASTGGVPAKFVNSAGWTGFASKDWVMVSGFGTSASANNGPWLVNAVSGNDMFVNGELVAASAGAEVTVSEMDYIVNGTGNSGDPDSYSIEVGKTGASDYALYTGMGVTGMQLEVPTGGLITLSFDFEGKVPANSGSSSAGTPTGPLVTESFNSASDFTHVWEGDQEFSVTSSAVLGWTNQATMLSLSLNVNPNLRMRRQLGTVGPSIVSARGSVQVTGTVRVYYSESGTSDDRVLEDKAVSNTKTSLAFGFRKGGKGYAIEIPTATLTSVSSPTPGRNEDVILEYAFQGQLTNNYPNTEEMTVRIARST